MEKEETSKQKLRVVTSGNQDDEIFSGNVTVPTQEVLTNVNAETIVEDQIPHHELPPLVLPPSIPLLEKRLQDQSLYRGQVNRDTQPHGLGILYQSFDTETYMGECCDGKPHGLGVFLHSTGAMYCGQVEDGKPCGYGVQLSTFGERLIGQWKEGTLNGVGMVTSIDGDVSYGTFAMGDLVEEMIEWNEVEDHFHLASLNQQLAIQEQEQAREKEVNVLMAAITTIDNTTMDNALAIQAFEKKEEEDLQMFLEHERHSLEKIQKEKSRWEWKETQLHQKYNQLRDELQQRRQELSFMTNVCQLAEHRKAQEKDAAATLAILQHQLMLLKNQVDKIKEEENG